MPNSPKLEKIFEAWWELEHCLPAKRAEFESELNRLVDDIVSQSDQRLNREQILDHLFSPYKEYRGQRRKDAKTLKFKLLRLPLKNEFRTLLFIPGSIPGPSTI